MWGGGPGTNQKQPNQYFLLQNFIFSHNEIRVRGEGVLDPPPPAPGDAELSSKTLGPSLGSTVQEASTMATSIRWGAGACLCVYA